MGNLSGPSIGALVLIILALLFAIVAMATDYWSTYFPDNNRGVIKFCGPTLLGGDVCYKYADLPDYPDYIKATLGAMVLGFLCTAAALFLWIFWILGLCSSDTIMKILKIGTIILLAVGLFWVVIAVIVWAAKDNQDAIDYKLGWSWGLAIVTAIFQIVGLVLICLAVRKHV